jgi:hypothetical protein
MDGEQCRLATGGMAGAGSARCKDREEPIYRMHRWFDVVDGQGPAARQYLTDMTLYLRDRHGVTCDGFIEACGPSTASCHIMIDFDDLAVFESWWTGLASDWEFGELQAAEHTISVQGTTQQSLLHSDTA